MKHFIALADIPADRLLHVLDVAARLKLQLKSTGRNDPILHRRTLAMIFEKPSLRTRASFAVAMTQLGGSALVLRPDEVGLGQREEIRDVARVLGGMCDGIMARVFAHRHVVELAEWSPVPVINGLSDYNHPCQGLADAMTIREHFKRLEGLTVAFVGDGNNVARSLAVACGKFGARFVLCSPPAYALPEDDLDRMMAQVPEMDLETCHDPAEAVRDADVIYTDVWVSMGQEAENDKRLRDFAGFSVDEKLLSAAPGHAVVMHCLPAHRGMEISDAVMEDPKRSLVFPQAENRLHAQKGLLAVLLGGV